MQGDHALACEGLGESVRVTGRGDELGAATMRDGLTALPDEERAEIEEAASVLRQVRSGSTRPLLPLSVVRKAAP
ncbi:hypothetical protein ACFTZF_51675 [Streptomyces mirabilis]|uniref:hypothetical protein n=1 Tax=Streptomyces mirabilis TaxID=68239 RepID=UPI0036258996